MKIDEPKTKWWSGLTDEEKDEWRRSAASVHVPPAKIDTHRALTARLKYRALTRLRRKAEQRASE